VIFSFIEAERADHSVPLMCRVLGVSRSGYYGWRERPPSGRERGDDALAERVRCIHRDSRGTYGAPRVHARLRSEGVRVGNKRVARLMREEGLQGCHHRRKKTRTTRRDPLAAPAEDLVERRFVAQAANKLWVADISYVPTWEGFDYLAFILDAYSRRLVGWAMADHLRSELVVDALRMAVGRRDPAPGLIHHSGQGSQGGFNRSKQHPRFWRCGMGRPKGWSSTMTGRAPMRSPGRPGVSRDVQRLFWARVAEGLTSEDAAVACGVSPAVGTRWFRDSGGMPQISLTMSGRYLSFVEREEIAVMRAQDVGAREIARRLGRSASTISRELRRNAATRGGTLQYRASTAQWKAEQT
jgi:transposase